MNANKSNQKTFQNTVSVISRRTRFSTAHLYEQKAFTPEQNAKIFGACYSKHGHGHDYVLEAFVEGPIDNATGLVINVNDLDFVMKTVIAPFDFRHVNFDVPDFKNVVPTTENLASYFKKRIETELELLGPQLKLNRLRLFETEDLWTEIRSSASSASRAPGFEITRQVEIRSMHHLENPFWSDEENSRVFGICYGLHGHNYHVQVTCTAEMDEKSGFVINRDDLDEILQREIVTPYDGVNLNQRFVNTSCEAVAHEFFKILEPHLTTRLVRVGIQETRKNYFEFPPAT